MVRNSFRQAEMNAKARLPLQPRCQLQPSLNDVERLPVVTPGLARRCAMVPLSSQPSPPRNPSCGMPKQIARVAQRIVLAFLRLRCQERSVRATLAVAPHQKKVGAQSENGKSWAPGTPRLARLVCMASSDPLPGPDAKPPAFLNDFFSHELERLPALAGACRRWELCVPG